MSQYERRDGDVVVYKEREKRNERGPDWTGTILLGGVEYRISLWEKGGRGTMLTGKVEESRNQQSRPAPHRGGDDRGGFQRGSDRGSFGGRSDRGFSGRDREQTRGHQDDDGDLPFASPFSIW